VRMRGTTSRSRRAGASEFKGCRASAPVRIDRIARVGFLVVNDDVGDARNRLVPIRFSRRRDRTDDKAPDEHRQTRPYGKKQEQSSSIALENQVPNGRERKCAETKPSENCPGRRSSCLIRKGFSCCVDRCGKTGRPACTCHEHAQSEKEEAWCRCW